MIFYLFKTITAISILFYLFISISAIIIGLIHQNATLLDRGLKSVKILVTMSMKQKAHKLQIVGSSQF